MSEERALTTLPSDGEFGVMVQTAKTLIESGFLPGSVNTPQKAVAIMMMSRELGIGPWAGLNGINVIQGKPTISPQLMLALINRSGDLDDMNIEETAGACTVTMKRKGRSPHAETFTMDMANKMGLSGRDNWKKQPVTMLKWRAISACARVVFPDVIIGFYTPEEIAPEMTIDMETGEIVHDDLPFDPDPLPAPEPAPAPKASKPKAAPAAAPPADDEADFEALLPDYADVPMSGLSGRQYYLLTKFGYRVADCTHPKHFENAWRGMWPDARALKDIPVTLGEFVDALLARHDAAEQAALPEVEAEAA